MAPTDSVRDPARLSTLHRLHLLDTPAEESFDRFSRLATKILHAPIALVSLVDRNRQFFKSCVGLPEPYAEWRETPLSGSFCRHVVHSGEPLIINDAREDPEHCNNDAIRELGAVAYLGCPLSYDDQMLGSFCVIHTNRHDWTDEEVSIAQDLAAAVMSEIRLRATSYEHAAALRAREKMLATVSHDLRAPLQSIMTSTALLSLKDLDGESNECIEIAGASASRMNRMIDDLLDVSTLEFDRLSVSTRAIDVGSLLEEVRMAVALVAQDRGIGLSFEYNETLNVLADRDRLLQALFNLLDNAMRLTPTGGTVAVGAGRRDGTVEFRVADTGPGIPEDKLDTIFDWSWHSDPESSGGTGLGLSITKGIILAHGGKIEARNRPEGGAEFVFSLIDVDGEWSL